jgi:hypothetical protein
LATEEYHKEILRRHVEFIVFENADWFTALQKFSGGLAESGAANRDRTATICS